MNGDTLLHEMGFRPGTENVAGIVGLAKALKLAEQEKEEFFRRISRLRQMFKKGIAESIPDIRINEHPEHHLPNILNASDFCNNGVNTGDIFNCELI